MNSANEKVGVFSLLGCPNVGKSTLLNRLVGEKISIVTDKPQTTRNRITGVLTKGSMQFIFIDTPGLHKPMNKLGEVMETTVKTSIPDMNAVLMMVNPRPQLNEAEARLLSYIKSSGSPAILLINKTDTVAKENLLAVMALYAEKYNFDTILPISAKTGDGVDLLTDTLQSYMTPEHHLFPDDAVCDVTERQLCAELIREKALLCLDKEVPHGIAVEITAFSESEEIITVEAVIYCEKESHKGIIIGKQGAMLKRISSAARSDIERLLGAKVYMNVWVKVKNNWRDNLNFVRTMGFEAD